MPCDVFACAHFWLLELAIFMRKTTDLCTVYAVYVKNRIEPIPVYKALFINLLLIDDKLLM